MTRAWVIGEALVDIVERPGTPAEVYPGGSPANVAVGLGRLGREVELITWFGQDRHGDAVAAHLIASGVRVGLGSRGAERTSSARATIAEDGSASYVFDLVNDYPEIELDDSVAVVHVGSIGSTIEPGATRLDGILRRARSQAIVTYDPNLRPSIMGSPEEVRGRVAALVDGAAVVKVSDEDLAWLEPGRDPHDVAREWATRGPALVVVTLGAEGSFAVTAGGSETSVPAPRVRVADTVGAGDSFMSGLIDGLWSIGLVGAGAHAQIAGLTPVALATLLAQAARIAAITVSRPGADPPTRAELA